MWRNPNLLTVFSLLAWLCAGDRATAESRMGGHGGPSGRKADLPKEITNTIGMSLAFVPAGEFTMGNTAAAIEAIRRMPLRWKGPPGLDDTPAHRVHIRSPFYIGKYEVTNAQFRRFRPDHDSTHFLGHTLTGDRQPVALVSWTDAHAFCRWMSRLEGRPYALPTEAEWEYACRAGTKPLYHWGDAVDPARLNYADRSAPFAWRRRMADDGHAVSAPVGSYPANPFGIHDLLGNVWEWCADWYDVSYYQRSPRDDPSGPTQGVLRVCRGGGWDAFPVDARSGNRGKWFPDDRYMAVGFRVVLRLGGKSP